MEQSGTDRFLQAWVEEFTRAVEMFSGQIPTLRCTRSKQLDASQIEDLVWWQQEFVGDGRFTALIGAKQSTLIALASGGEGGDPAEAQATYLEMIGQAQSGAAHVSSAGFDVPVQCQAGQLGKAPSVDSLLYALVGISVAGTEYPALVFAIEPSIELVLNPPQDEEPASQVLQVSATNAPPPGGPQGAMLSRLMELELPLSIALGRATLPIREVLRVTTGSVIELDRNVGDSVELLVHGTVVAKGEVVSVKGNYGVRIKEIISQQDRIHLYKRD